MKKLLVLSGLLPGLLCAVDFPEIRGTLHNESTLDLSKLEMTVTYQCDDPETGPCGNKRVTALWDSKKQTFRIPAVVLGPDPSKADYFVSGWGKRYDVILGFSLPSYKGVVAHDLKHWSWENRGLRQMLLDLEREFAELTLFQVKEAGGFRLPSRPALEGKELRLFYQRQFLPIAETDDADVGKIWLMLPAGATTKIKDALELTLPPMLYVLRGQPKKYGKTPRTHTVISLYTREKIEGKDGLALRGVLDEEGTFSADGHFGGERWAKPVDPGLPK